jgi:hypothetical protein
MDLQTIGGKPVTSENVPSIDNLRAHSPQIPDDNRLQPDTSAIDDPQAPDLGSTLVAVRQCPNPEQRQPFDNGEHSRTAKSAALLHVRYTDNALIVLRTSPAGQTSVGSVPTGLRYSRLVQQCVQVSDLALASVPSRGGE